MSMLQIMKKNNQVSLVEREGFGSPFFIYNLCLKIKIAIFLKQKDRKRPLRFLLFSQILLGLQRLTIPGIPISCYYNLTKEDNMCDNNVSFFVPRGFDYKEILVPCGRTDPFGGLALCDDHHRQRQQLLTNSDEPEDIGYQDY